MSEGNANMAAEKRRKYSVLGMVVGITLIEGLAITLNEIFHPNSQPGLTIFISLAITLIMGTWLFFASRSKNTKFY